MNFIYFMGVFLCFFSMAAYPAVRAPLNIEKTPFYKALPDAFHVAMNSVYSSSVPMVYYSVRAKNRSGLYFTHTKVCVFGSCKYSRPEYTCYKSYPIFYGWKLSKNRLFKYSRHMACIETVDANTRHLLSFYSNCYVNKIIHGNYIHFIKHVTLSAGRDKNFSLALQERRNYPLVERDIGIYHQYQFRSRSCVVKKLPQLHHG